MAKEKRSSSPPQRKEPGLIARGFSWCVGITYWLILSLIVSIVIEWIGIAFFWPEQGSEHAKEVLIKDHEYLNGRVAQGASLVVQNIKTTTLNVNNWVAKNSGFKSLSQEIETSIGNKGGAFQQWTQTTAKQYRVYIDAVPYVTQIFFVRLALVILSLPAFGLFAIIGIVDGLVERDLRRWGGGRESSTVYNIARKSVFRFFVAACVIYLSFPMSVAPAWIIIPFALAFGLSTRITFERLKKYF